MSTTDQIILSGQLTVDPRSTQRMTALAHANEIRRRRGSLKTNIAAGHLTIAEVLDDPAVQTAAVFELLRAPRRMGPSKAKLVLRMIGASTALRVRDLTDRQRTELLAILSAGGH